MMSLPVWPHVPSGGLCPGVLCPGGFLSRESLSGTPSVR